MWLFINISPSLRRVAKLENQKRKLLFERKITGKFAAVQRTDSSFVGLEPLNASHADNSDLTLFVLFWWSSSKHGWLVDRKIPSSNPAATKPLCVK